MLFVHKAIDALLERDKKYKLMPIPGVTREARQAMAATLEAAEKFDFGELILEPNPYKEGAWMLPEITQDERGFWRDGLIPLPAAWTWYEFSLGGFRSGILCYEKGTKWRVERMDLTWQDILFDDIQTSVDREECLLDQDWDILIEGNTGFIKDLERKTDSTFRQNHLGQNIPLAIYLSLMLNSRSTEKRLEVPDSKLNKARLKRGVTPLQAHRVVTIVPNRYLVHAESTSGDTRRSPRLHWRRSHLRVLRRGTETERRIVIPRMLVNKDEVGAVTHEYRVKLSQ